MQNRKPFRERYNKSVVDNRSTDDRIRSNHYLYTERIIMHVMADLSRRDGPTTNGATDAETRLCSVTYDKARKLLTISPDFTSYGVEHEQHYAITNGYGVRFDYRIEHVFEGRMTPLELQERCENTRRVSMRLFMMDVRDIPDFRVTAFARTDQKDGLFVEKSIPTFPSDVDLFALRRSCTFIPDAIPSGLTHLFSISV